MGSAEMAATQGKFKHTPHQSEQVDVVQACREQEAVHGLQARRCRGPFHAAEAGQQQGCQGDERLDVLAVACTASQATLRTPPSI